jgi:formate hydrogenlyase subunit 3/multisubunit Na+/H+ antiporter MnhD subunit
MTETRIVLPGVQALLGFQFAAYLTQAFAKLPADARLAHDVSLILLLSSMVFLMTPAPFHRLAEDGQETERLCRLTVTMIVLALAALALGLAADVYVATMVVMKNSAAALVAAGSAAAIGVAVWFVYPLLSRRSARALALSRRRRALGGGAHHA